MNEKYLEGLAQYDRMTDSVRKGRSGWICETDRGTALLQEYRGTLRRLEFEDLVLSRVEEDGQIPGDQYIKTKEDSLIALGADGTRYVLKEWFTDRECSLKDHKEVLLAVRQIARLHKCLAKIPRSEEWSLGSIHGESLEQEMKRPKGKLQLDIGHPSSGLCDKSGFRVGNPGSKEEKENRF